MASVVHWGRDTWDSGYWILWATVEEDMDDRSQGRLQRYSVQQDRELVIRRERANDRDGVALVLRLGPIAAIDSYFLGIRRAIEAIEQE